MSKKRLYKYILRDGKGNSRGTCVAGTIADARDKFKSRGLIGDRTSWSVSLGNYATPAEVAKDKTKDRFVVATVLVVPEAKPDPFKPGDRVRRTKHLNVGHPYLVGAKGTVSKVDFEGVWVKWDGMAIDAHPIRYNLNIAAIELIPTQHGYEVGSRVRRIKNPNSTLVPVGSTGIVIPVPLEHPFARLEKHVFIQWDHLLGLTDRDAKYLAPNLPCFIEAIPEGEDKGAPKVESIADLKEIIEDQARRLEQGAKARAELMRERTSLLDHNATLRRQLDQWETGTDTRVRDLEKQLQEARAGIPKDGPLEARIKAIRETHRALGQAAFEIENEFKITIRI